MPDFPLGLTMGMILSIPMMLLVGAWLLLARPARAGSRTRSRKTMSLLDRLRAQIAQDGLISVAEYFTCCLHDPRDGYYANRPALGEGGDFLTAPGASQMFGELIGLLAAGDLDLAWAGPRPCGWSRWGQATDA